jgi:hypothetical protein
MSLILDGTAGLTFNNATTQASSSKVLQVVNATYSTQTSTASTSYVTTNLTATITPLFNTSKILILVTIPCYNANSASAGMSVTVFRGTVSGTNLGSATWGFGALNAVGSAIYTPYAITVQDSPATTSATTYTVGFKSDNASNTVTTCSLTTPASITLMEIAA